MRKAAGLTVACIKEDCASEKAAVGVSKRIETKEKTVIGALQPNVETAVLQRRENCNVKQTEYRDGKSRGCFFAFSVVFIIKKRSIVRKKKKIGIY
ncbi:MAG: hypothetical protein IJX87_02270 [Clostridia bacterium]|nr:hypothetical protein [Clostridia bacterium]